MSDPIERLTRLGDALEGAPMPLPASEVRARGDRIRRRKHAVIAGASAAVVAAVTIPVVAFTLGEDDQPDRIAPQPTISDPVQTGALGPSNLLTSEDAIYPTGGVVDWHERDTVEGAGEASYSPCAKETMADLGAQSAWQRDFDFVIVETGEVDASNDLNEIVAEFPSAADAEAAYTEISGWFVDCLPSGADRFDAGAFRPVPIGVEGQAESQVSTYVPVAGDPLGVDSWWLDTGLVLSGDRIAVLTQRIAGQDYIFEQGTPVEQMLPAAAERLVLGGAGQVDPTDPSAVEGAWETRIPDAFPLTDGWPADDGSDEYQLAAPSRDNQAMASAVDLEGCGQPVDDGDPVDRLTARLNLGSAYYGRELQLFADPDQAAAYVDSIQDAYSACEETRPGYEVDMSGNTLVVKWSEAIYRSVTMAYQVDNAVVVTIQGDEGATGTETVDRLATAVGEDMTGVLLALAELLDGDAGTDPGSSSVDTTIRDDFPLDAYLGDPPTADSETTLTGPEHGLEAIGDLAICGLAPMTVTPADRLGYAASGPEWGEQRELRTYGDAQVAVDEVQAVRDALVACRREQLDGGATRVYEVFDDGDQTGSDSVTFGYTLEQGNGSPLTSGAVITVLRRGSAVLLVAQDVSPSGPSVRSAVPAHLEGVGVITPSMCEFTEDGCL